MGVLTITSIIVANKISSKKIAALAVASEESQNELFRSIRTRLSRSWVRSKIEKIRDEIAQDRVNSNPVKFSRGYSCWYRRSSLLRHD